MALLGSELCLLSRPPVLRGGEFALYRGRPVAASRQQSSVFHRICPRRPTARAGLALGLALNIVGLNIGKWLHNLGAIGSWVPALMLIVMGTMAWLRFGA